MEFAYVFRIGNIQLESVKYGSNVEDPLGWQFVYGILTDCIGIDAGLTRGALALDEDGKMLGIISEVEVDSQEGNDGQVILSRYLLYIYIV